MEQNSRKSTENSQTMTGRFRSPFTNSSPIKRNLDHSHDEYYSEFEPAKIPISTGTTRSFRDQSGRIRFLCSNPECKRRVPRRSETFCKKHQVEAEGRIYEHHRTSVTTHDRFADSKDHHSIEDMDLNHHATDLEFQVTTSQNLDVKRSSELSSNKIVVSTTTLSEGQWLDVLEFLRQFRHVQLGTNLNVNNSTTHLLIDDSAAHLRCTITKKIVQAAVRRHILIVSVRWVHECLNCQKIIDERPFEIVGDSHTALRLSQQDFQYSSRYLFDSNALKTTYGFAIECRQCQGSINRNELVELIQLSGAKLFDNDPKVDVLIILCDNNEKNVDKIKEKYCNLKIPTIKFVASDFLLKSIIKFEIQEIEKYSL